LVLAWAETPLALPLMRIARRRSNAGDPKGPTGIQPRVERDGACDVPSETLGMDAEKHAA